MSRTTLDDLFMEDIDNGYVVESIANVHHIGKYIDYIGDENREGLFEAEEPIKEEKGPSLFEFGSLEESDIIDPTDGPEDAEINDDFFSNGDYIDMVASEEI